MEDENLPALIIRRTERNYFFWVNRFIEEHAPVPRVIKSIFF